MIRACIFDLGGTIVDKYSLTPFLSLQKIFSEDNKQIGSITSGTFGPSVNGPIAMGYVKLNFSKLGTKVLLEVRGKKYNAKISQLPFYKKNYVR